MVPLTRFLPSPFSFPPSRSLLLTHSTQTPVLHIRIRSRYHISYTILPHWRFRTSVASSLARPHARVSRVRMSVYSMVSILILSRLVVDSACSIQVLVQQEIKASRQSRHPITTHDVKPPLLSSVSPIPSIHITANICYNSSPPRNPCPANRVTRIPDITSFSAVFCPVLDAALLRSSPRCNYACFIFRFS